MQTFAVKGSHNVIAESSPNVDYLNSITKKTNFTSNESSLAVKSIQKSVNHHKRARSLPR